MDAETRLDLALREVADCEARIRAAQAAQLIAVEAARVAMLEMEAHPSRSESVNREFGERAFVAELATTLRIHRRSAGRMSEDAAILASTLPATRDALAAGTVGLGQARDLIDTARTLPETVVPVFEAQALGRAAGVTPPAFRRVLRRLRERLHAAPLTERRAAARVERRVVLEPVEDGMAWLHLYLEAERAVAVCARLRFDAERDQRGDRGGSAAEAERRTRAQRELDRAAELLLGEAVRDTGAGVNDAFDADTRPASPIGTVRPRIHVTVPVLTLLGLDDEPAELDGYGPIDADTAIRLTKHAPSMRRILTHPETGARLSYGRTSYRVPADLADHIRNRDGTCRFPGCTTPATDCDLDHIRAWQHGGTTDADNLISLCRGDHRLKHETRWHVEPVPDPTRPGTLRWTSPAGREYLTHPEHPDTGEPRGAPRTRAGLLDADDEPPDSGFAASG